MSAEGGVAKSRRGYFSSFFVVVVALIKGSQYVRGLTLTLDVSCGVLAVFLQNELIRRISPGPLL